MIQFQVGNVFTAARASSPEELDAISEALSYVVPDIEYIRRRNPRLRHWDGRKSFFDRRNGCFLTGFLWALPPVLKRMGIEANYQDRRVRHEVPDGVDWANVLHGITLRDYQVRACEDFMKRGRGVGHLPTGAGKCLAKGTKVLMFDGTVKNVEDVQVGDLLMGDDSTPRSVLSLAHGFEEMYRVTPVKGDPYVVNRSHILSLKLTGDASKHMRDIKKSMWGRFDADGVIDVPVEEYLALSKTAKHLLKGYRVGVEFPERQVPVDPYFLGVWLGDGRSNSPVVCTPDYEIRDYTYEFANSIDHLVTKYPEPSLADSYAIVTPDGRANPLLNALRELDVIRNKHVPHVYKANSRKVRLRLLAGLIDTDGSLHESNYYEITFKPRRLAEDTAYLARSLGLAAYVKPKPVGGIVYYRVGISGHIDMIPSKIWRKRASERRQKKNVLVTSIKVEPMGMSEYFGFTLDGNGRFLLGDFTVTHNTEIAMALVRGTDLNTLFLTHRAHLLHQTHRRFLKRMPQLQSEIGIIGDSIYSPNRVTVATVQTLDAIFRAMDDLNDLRKAKLTEEELERQLAPLKAKGPKSKLSQIDREKVTRLERYLKTVQTSDMVEARFRELVAFLDEMQLLIIDEAHRSGAKQFHRPALFCKNAYYRLSLTATPFMKGSARDDMMLMGLSGPVVSRVSYEELIERGVLARPFFKFLKIDRPDLTGKPWRMAYANGIVHNAYRNEIVTMWAAKTSLEMRKKTLVIVVEKEHGRLLEALLSDKGMRAKYLDGDNTQGEREKALKLLSRDKLDCVIATSIFDEGVDVEDIGAVILAGGTKSAPALYQRSGRAMRKKEESNVAIIIDCFDHHHPKLLEHSERRYELIKGQPGFTII